MSAILQADAPGIKIKEACITKTRAVGKFTATPIRASAGLGASREMRLMMKPQRVHG